MTDNAKPAFDGTSAAPCSASDAGQEVIHWAQAILTALNTGSIEQDSPIHHKLREAVVRYNDATRKMNTPK